MSKCDGDCEKHYHWPEAVVWCVLIIMVTSCEMSKHIGDCETSVDTGQETQYND